MMECRAKKGRVNHRRECKTQEPGEKPSQDIEKIKPPQWRLESISRSLSDDGLLVSVKPLRKGGSANVLPISIDDFHHAILP